MTSSSTRDISDGTLALRIADDGTECMIVLRGELDLANAGTAETALETALASGMPVVLDMRALEFIDSTGIALLVRAIQGDGSAGRLSFVPSEFDAVNKVLALTGVDERMALAEGSAPA
ncbi:MAG TPA: STAS domain-containing protein [Solirubrobacterales bacterium]|nr:STAS domain-containing protein [Solirubrobacterales bacterium]